ncbi:xylulokinase [Paraglaciecola sp. T6c]|uniref:xylulokinase n=1 Tax=Pseudoalteromonas atlantica (strain T6c / ATCC BAA-1087) TaxID=3042615 RepID=UPI00005C6E6A|nr:xylulokinase [Paraglaciecola sp. T6c]ABG42227.1 xylulokinase [Paraglaciecola sp. T6c]
MFLGVDLGTSGIKLVLTDNSGAIVDSASCAFEVSRPKPLWSEQNPQDWWDGFCTAMDKLHAQHDLSDVLAIGFAGQMHGATLLDEHQQVLRPAILWNDGRCEAQCAEIEQRVPNAHKITGNIIMPGFTAPKLLWVKQHEPELFAKIDKVLLPKDYLRLLLSGDFASDMSDAAGTMWLDVDKRCWHADMLNVCGLNESHMPTLFEGNAITGTLSDDVAKRWNMKSVPLVAGAGDNAAGAIGVGIVKPGQAMLSLGTSGVYFAVSEGFRSNPESAVHSFCHALPHTWHLMSVMLSAASCLQWYAEQVVKKEVSVLLAELEQTTKNQTTNTQDSTQNGPLFLPYLSGERTPHNNPNATGAFFGLTHSSSQAALTHSVLEGVTFGLADGVDALHASGVQVDEITLIGGGAKSAYWRQLIADVLQRPVTYRQGGDVGPGLGAARLAQLAMQPEKPIKQICPQPTLDYVYQPNLEKAKSYAQRRATFSALYKATQEFL